MVHARKIRLTLVIDPRFGGGTSSAVAREIRVFAPICDLRVVALSSKLFKGKTVHAAIAQACAETGTPLVWDPATVQADVIALHNPSFVKFDSHLATRFVCDRLFVVCHENFVRPDGPESFDVAHCLRLIADATLARIKLLAPVSGWNRTCTKKWLQDRDVPFAIAPLDWTNICDFDHQDPTNTPRDRRGRHSRAGAEKFPPMPDMLSLFPATTEAVHILGADSLLNMDHPAHWNLSAFGSQSVDSFLQKIDFFVYYTHPSLQESFGRVIAEAMAAGKVVITSPGTAATFGDGVIAAHPDAVDGIVADLIANPDAYQTQARKGQAALAAFSPAAFLARFHTVMDATATRDPAQSKKEMVFDLL